MSQPDQTSASREQLSPGGHGAACRSIDNPPARAVLPCGGRNAPPREQKASQQAARTLARTPQPPKMPDGRRGLGLKPLVALDSMATVVSCRRGQEVYRQTDAIDHWYRVLSGLAKEHAMMADGRDQIVDFLLPGDFFGLGARDRHQFTVEVVADGTVLASYARREVERLAERDPELGRLIREEAFEAMSRAQARMVTLGRTSAPQKVGAFLLEMAERLAGGRAGTVALPMSRYDIADYLGLSVEAVSRSLTKLKGCGAIRLAGTRRVSILDRSALEWG